MVLLQVRWGELPITVPGQGPQSWFFARSYLWHWQSWSMQGVTPFSTRPRNAVQVAQQQYWIRHCGFFCQLLPVTSHPSLVSRKSCRVSPLGLVVNIFQAQQELCVPPSVFDSLSTWLATQCEQFASGQHQCYVAEVPSPSPTLKIAGQFSIAISERSPQSR